MISATTEKSWLPHPRQGLSAKFQRGKLQFLSLLTTILKALICWKLESFRGLRPLGPRQGLCPKTPPGALWRAPGPHPYDARTGIFRPFFFSKSWIRHWIAFSKRNNRSIFFNINIVIITLPDKVNHWFCQDSIHLAFWMIYKKKKSK